MKKISILCLILIGLISIPLKLYTVDFSLPSHLDDFRFVLDAVQYNQGDFFLSQKKHPGLSLVLTPFISIIDSNNFVDYSNLARGLSLVISTVSILPMYLLARKFFSEKYSLVAAGFFALEPHLNHNAGAAMSEPLFILCLILTALFILNSKAKFHYLAFIFAGFCWWIKLEAVFPIMAIILIYFVINRKKSNYKRNFILCMVLYVVVIAPLFVQRDLQFDDPFYIWYTQTIFSDSYADLLTTPEDSGLENFVGEYGASGIFDRLGTGISNLFVQLIQISYPFLLILLPFGILFSLRPVNHDSQYVKSNWIMILVSIVVLIIPFAIINDRRYLFSLFPFLIILSTIPIYRVTNFGLNTFAFNEKQKSYFLVIVVVIALVLSVIFTTGIAGFGFGPPDYLLEQEKIEFTKYLVDNHDGQILRDETVIDYLGVVSLTSDTNSNFKEFKSPRGKDPYPNTYKQGDVVWLSVNGNNLNELIINGENRGLRYLSVVESGSYFFPYLDDVYNDDKNYPFLKKIMDSESMGYLKLKQKIFEIDYESFKKFHEP